MINVAKFNTFSEFLIEFMQDRELSQKELGDLTDVSDGQINHLVRGRRLPGDKFLKNLANVFGELELIQLQVLVKRDRKLRTDQKQGKKKTEEIIIKSSDKQEEEKHEGTTEGASNNNVGEIPTISSIEDEDSNMYVELVEKLKEHPNLMSALLNLTKYSDEIQSEVINHINDYAESSINSKIQKYTHKEFKRYFVETAASWIQSTKPVGYDGRKVESTHFSTVGHLQLSNSGLFFSLVVTAEYLSVTTRQQDAELINEYINLLSGLKVKTRTYGPLANVYASSPICKVTVFNPATFVMKVKSLIKSMDVHINKSTFTNDSYAEYFK